MRHSNYRALLWLGIPIVIGQIGVIILGFADTLMIGHHSTHELAAASFVNNMFNLAIIFSTGFSYGLTPFPFEKQPAIRDHSNAQIQLVTIPNGKSQSYSGQNADYA